ncbi:DUF6261 family protein [Labilibacter marinus]|uniref:DUF6261 family protein n=1 Tax=Labilibacter marinus TaxID=1477105 RepID=UPI00082CEC30|nr:DUF6261 family protein [Labilibacter marinus]
MIEKLRCDSRIADVNTVSMQILGILQTNDWSSDSHLGSIINELRQLQMQLNLTFNQSKTELLLDDKDIERAFKLRSLLYLLQGFIHHPDSTINEAAKEVKAVFDVYGISISYEISNEELSLMKSLLNDLYTTSLVEAMSVLSGCMTLRDELKIAQNNFENLLVAHQSKNDMGEKRVSANSFKKKLVYLINKKLLVYLIAMYQVDKAVYGDLCIAVAQVINSNNNEIKVRLDQAVMANV